MHPIDEEDLREWRANPVTERVFMALDALAAEAKARWVQASWEGGQCDERLRADLYARADVIDGLKTVTAEQIEEKIEEHQRNRTN